jgi:predicted choloylglycine hydrolase
VSIPYHTFTLAGDPATIGRLQAEGLRMPAQPPRSPRPHWADDGHFLEQCAALLRAVAPAVWAEIAACAEVVGVPAGRGLFLRAGAMPHGCSAFAWRLADDRVIAGRNYDFVVSFPSRHLLDTRPTAGFAHLGMNGGLVGGRYDGVNERGLFVALHKVNAQRSERVAPGLPPHLIVRAALETCGDAAEAVRLIAAVPHLAPFNYTLADAVGRLVALEC